MRQGDSLWPLMLAVWTWLKTLLPWASLGFTEKSDSTRRSHTADKACDHQTLSPQKSNLQKLFCWRQLTALRDTGVVQIKHTYTTHWISATRFKCTLLVVHSINWFIVTNIFGEIHFLGGGERVFKSHVESWTYFFLASSYCQVSLTLSTNGDDSWESKWKNKFANYSNDPAVNCRNEINK